MLIGKPTKNKRLWKRKGLQRSRVASSANQENFRLQTFTRRAFVVALGQGAIFSILGARLAWLQVAQEEKYSSLSENNRVNVLMLAPDRGQIVDRYGVPLAINVRDYRAVIVPEKTEDVRTALLSLRRFLKLSDRE